MGSIKNKIVASDLEDERAHCNFDQKELTLKLFKDQESLNDVLEDIRIMESDPILRNTEKWYELNRDETFDLQLKKVARYYELYKEKYFTNFRLRYLP
jgi:hypothetical protein